MKEELKKIEWTKPKDMMTNFIIVICFSVFMTGLVYGLDALVLAVSNAIRTLV